MQNLFINFFTLDNGFWNQIFIGNSIRDYTISIIILLVSILFFLLMQYIVLAKLEKIAKKTKTDADDVLIETVKKIRPPFYWFLSFYIAAKFLTFPQMVDKILDSAIIIFLVLQILTTGSTFINYLFQKLANRQKDPSSKIAIEYLTQLTKISLWIIGILLILSNLGFNITSLIAGLGIGGIAIAFALQNILSDLFSSFAIWFDKPFVINDVIKVGQHTGTVEKIGIKTTRIRSLQGEEIIISNKDLTSAQIQNFKRLKERRAVFSVGIEYQTPPNKLKDIPLMIQRIIKDMPQARFSRAHFARFDDSALIFEIAYYVESEEYSIFMDIQQAINLAIHETFHANGIIMAYPTQTIHLAKKHLKLAK